MRTSLALCLALATLPGAQRSNARGPRLDDNGDPLPEQAVARFGTIRFAHGKYVLGVAFSPDGKTLAAASPNEIVLWETSTGKPLRRLPAPMSGGWSLAFSPDGKTLATLSHGSVIVWDVATGDQRRCALPVKSARTVRYSPDGKHLAVTGEDGDLVSWDVAGKNAARRFEGHTGRVWWADWSPDGKRLASCAEDGTVRLWDAATGAGAGRFYKKGEQTVDVRTVVFSPDGSTLAGRRRGAEAPSGRAATATASRSTRCWATSCCRRPRTATSRLTPWPSRPTGGRC